MFVVNIEAKPLHAMEAVVSEEAEKTLGVRVGSVVVGVAGLHIKGLNSHGIVAVRGGEKWSARGYCRSRDQRGARGRDPAHCQVLHILPQFAVTNNMKVCAEPLTGWVSLKRAFISSPPRERPP